MNDFWRRVVAAEGGGPVIRAGGVPVGTLVERLEAGESPAGVATSLGLEPIDLVAALAHDALGEQPDGGPPLVQGSPPRPKLARALGETPLGELFPALKRPARLALSAGLLQVYDFWDASHHAAQEADDLGEARVSAYWHGIGHRREPDAGNAGYWFRRVGRHPIFPGLADAARPLIDAAPAAQAEALRARGGWDPLAFIELCTRAKGPSAVLARSLQRIEMILLLDASLPG